MLARPIMAERKRKCLNCDQEHCKPWDEKCKRERVSHEAVAEASTQEEEVTQEAGNNAPTLAMVTELLTTVRNMNERFNYYDEKLEKLSTARMEKDNVHEQSQANNLLSATAETTQGSVLKYCGEGARPKQAKNRGAPSNAPSLSDMPRGQTDQLSNLSFPPEAAGVRITRQMNRTLQNVTPSSVPYMPIGGGK